MVKFAPEMSKKILPTASTLTRAVVVGALGTVTFSVPSLGVLVSSTVGKLFPPSVESEILTLAQLTGAAVVLATFHVTVWVEPAAQLTAVLGAVTTNGPLVADTLTCIESELMPPPFERLSRAVT